MIYVCKGSVLLSCGETMRKAPLPISGQDKLVVPALREPFSKVTDYLGQITMYLCHSADFYQLYSTQTRSKKLTQIRPAQQCSGIVFLAELWQSTFNSESSSPQTYRRVGTSRGVQQCVMAGWYIPRDTSLKFSIHGSCFITRDKVLQLMIDDGHQL